MSNFASINMTFESPDTLLSGSGEFDISETFKNLFINNPALQEQIQIKITDIFSQIKSNDIASNWQEKLKNLMNFTKEDKDKFNNTINDNINKTLEKIKLDPIDFAKTYTTKQTPNINKETSNINKTINLFEKESLKISTKIYDLLKNQEQRQIDNESAFDNKGITIKEFSPTAIEQFKKTQDIKGLSGLFDKLKAGFGNLIDAFKEKGSFWGNLIGLIGGGLLLYLNKEKIKKWLEETQIGKELLSIMDGIWTHLKTSINNFIYDKKLENSPLGQLARVLDRFNKEGIIFKITDVFGVTASEDDPTRGTRKTLFNALIIQPIKKASQLLLKMFSGKGITELIENSFPTLTKMFSKEGGEVIVKEGAEIAGKAIVKKAGTKILLTTILKKIPIISALVGLGEGISRIANGNIEGGLIAIASGVAGSFPFLGTGISIALDAYNAVQDIQHGGDKGRASSGFNKMWTNFLQKYGKRIPFLNSLIYMSEAFGYFSQGQWKSGFKSVGYALAGAVPFANILTMFLTDDEKQNNATIGKAVSITEAIGNWLKSKLKNLPAPLRLALSALGIEGLDEDIEMGSGGTTTKTMEQTAELEMQYLNRLQELKTRFEKQEIDYKTADKLFADIREGYSKDGVKTSVKDLNLKTEADVVVRKEAQPVQNAVFSGVKVVPHQNDQLTLFEGKESGMLSKQGGFFDKGFQKITTVLELHGQYLQKIEEFLKLSIEDLNMIAQNGKTTNDILPRLKPEPIQNQKSFPATDVRDPIYEYRLQRYTESR